MLDRLAWIVGWIAAQARIAGPLGRCGGQCLL